MNGNLENLAKATPSDVLNVYSGKDGKCCCGCSGKYSYNSKRVEEGSKERGYTVDPEDCNDKMISKVLALMKGNLDVVDVLSPEHFTLVVGTRLYMLILSRSMTAVGA
jgi:hypothetical protein